MVDRVEFAAHQRLRGLERPRVGHDKMNVGAPHLPAGLGYRVLLGDDSHEPWVVLCGVPDPDETRGEVPNGFGDEVVPLSDCVVEVVSETLAALAVSVF